MKIQNALSAIAEPTRLKIIQALGGGMKSVTDLAKTLSCEIVNVSHHLGVMRNAEVLVTERVGRFQMYQLHPDYFTVSPDTITMTVPGIAKLELTREKPQVS